MYIYIYIYIYITNISNDSYLIYALLFDITQLILIDLLY